MLSILIVNIPFFRLGTPIDSKFIPKNPTINDNGIKIVPIIEKILSCKEFKSERTYVRKAI